jgi:hypothetical protein
MAAHRYWRVYVLGATVALAGVQLRTVAGGPTVAAGGVASASGGTAAAAWDGDEGTVWTATGSAVLVSAAWVQYALPAAADVIEVAVTMATVNAPVAMVVAWSDDGVAWQHVTPGALGGAAGATVVWSVPGGAGGAIVSAGPASWSPREGGWVPEYTVLRAGPVAILAHAGTARIAGDVGIAGTPDVMVARRVRLHLRATGYLVRETWSDPVTGAYAFEDLAPLEYMVLSMDHLGIHNAVIADRIIAA